MTPSPNRHHHEEERNVNYLELRNRSKAASRARREFHKRPELEGRIHEMLDAGESKADIARTLRTSNLVVEACMYGLTVKDLEPKYPKRSPEESKLKDPPRQPRQKLRTPKKHYTGGDQPSGRGQSDPVPQPRSSTRRRSIGLWAQ